MNIGEILLDKTIGAKQKVETIARALKEGQIKLSALITLANTLKDGDKANAIEAIEYVCRENPKKLNEEGFLFVCEQLGAKAPRIRWESSKVIAHTAKHFSQHIPKAVLGLTGNIDHSGTVVRWSAATALGEIFKLNTVLNSELRPLFEKVIASEEKNSIKKIYEKALKGK